MNEISYKFVKTFESKTTFAQVDLIFLPQANKTTIKVTCNLSELANCGYELEWANAALNGVNRCVSFVNERKKNHFMPGSVILKNILGILVDSNCNAFECAGMLGTHLLLLPDEKLPELSDEPPWEVHLPE